METSVFIYIISYLLYFFSILSLRYARLSFLLGFFVFFSIQFGPHTVIFTNYLEVSRGSNELQLDKLYNYILSFIFICNSIILLFFKKYFRYILSINAPKHFNTSHLTQTRYLVYVITSLLILMSLLLQPGFMNITKQHVLYLIGASSYDYKSIRRIIFSLDNWQSYAAIIRYTLCPIITGYLMIILIDKKTMARKVIMFSFIIIFLLITCIQLNKLFYLYYSSLLLIVFFTYKYKTIPRIYFFSEKTLLTGIAITLLLIVFVHQLYLFQYREIVNAGVVTKEYLFDAVIHRSFFAASDALRLWIDYYLITHGPEGLSIISKLCFLAENCVNPNVFIPDYYLGRELTSLQVGFIGTGLGLIGIWGVPFITILLICILFLNMHILYMLRNTKLFYIASPITFLNSYFITSSELHTAALSGGVVSIPIFLSILSYKIKKISYK